jgi:superfamily II DNA or RNA helicase
MDAALSVQDNMEEEILLIGEVGGFRSMVVLVGGIFEGTEYQCRQVRGTCTCGAGQNCEHMGAVVLRGMVNHLHSKRTTDGCSTTVDEPTTTGPLAPASATKSASTGGTRGKQRQATFDPALAAGLEWLAHDDHEAEAQASMPPPARKAPAKQRLLYGLRFLESGLLDLALFRQPQLKSGAWGKPAYVSDDPFDIPRRHQIQSANEDDAAILAAWCAAQRANLDHFDAEPLFTGVVGQHLLNMVLKSERAFLQREPPVVARPGPSAVLSWRWIQEGPLWRLGCQVAGHAEAAIVQQPPCYLAKDGQVGPLMLPASRVLDQLTQLPPVPPSLLPELLPRLRRYLGSDCPEPPADAVPTLAAFTPVLQLDEAEIEWHEHQWSPGVPRVVEVARARWDYGDGGLLEPGVGTYLPDGRWRDAAGEQRRLQELMSAGAMRAASLRQITVNKRVAPPDLQVAGLKAGVFDDAALRRLLLRGWRIDGRQPSLHRIIVHTPSLTVGGREDQLLLSASGSIDGQAVDLVPVLALALAGGAAALDRLPHADIDGVPHLQLEDPTDPSRVLLLPRPLVDRLAAILERLHDREPEQRGWRLEQDQALELALSEGDHTVRWLSGERLQRLAASLRRLAAEAAATPPEADPPTDFGIALRPYQRQGLAWLQRQRELGLGAVLADDMGLGKTIQTLAFIAAERLAGRLARGALVVAPVSTLGNWAREAARACPGLPVLVWHGLDRANLSESLGDAALVITSYATLLRDGAVLGGRGFDLAICDEAQALRNAGSRTSGAVRGIDAPMRLALTGTPLENNLDELWSLMHWVEPGLLGSHATFERGFVTPITKAGDAAAAGRLRRRLAPFLLRRTKDIVARELPPRTVITEEIDLAREQSALYETVRATLDDRLRAVIAERGLARSRIQVLETFLRLRQVCCDPSLLPEELHGGLTASGKREHLIGMLQRLVGEGRRVLVFSSFVRMLELLADDLAAAGIEHLLLTGATRDRQDLIDRFQAGGVPVFLISLKAGGTGLNLTAADTVIHYDPWWNPAAEDQASDRAHRIGQDKPVFIYRLVAAGTIEARVIHLQERKRLLASNLFDDSGQSDGGVDQAVIDELLAPIGDSP